MGRNPNIARKKGRSQDIIVRKLEVISRDYAATLDAQRRELDLHRHALWDLLYGESPRGGPVLWEEGPNWRLALCRPLSAEGGILILLAQRPAVRLEVHGFEDFCHKALGDDKNRPVFDDPEINALLLRLTRRQARLEDADKAQPPTLFGDEP